MPICFPILVMTLNYMGQHVKQTAKIQVPPNLLFKTLA